MYELVFSDSRDVSSVVADTEMFLEVHGFVRWAELEMRRRRRRSCERRNGILLHVYCRRLQRADVSFKRRTHTHAHFVAPVI